MPVLNARFDELLQDIEPSRTTKSQASAAHTRIRDHLRKQDSFKIVKDHVREHLQLVHRLTAG